MPRKRQPANQTRLLLPMSHTDCAYLVNLVATDITRLKGSGERSLLRTAYRLHDKLHRLQGGEGGTRRGR